MRPVTGLYFFVNKKTTRRGKEGNPAGDLLQRRLRSLFAHEWNDEGKGDALYLIIAASGQPEHYHKQAARSRLKSSGGAHASASAAAFFMQLQHKTTRENRR